jgi:hypothetical protein
MSLDLDEIKSFLAEVQAGATDDPGTFATTAISNFKRLLEVTLQLAGAVEHQTRAIQKLLDDDLATVSGPPLPVPAPYYPQPPPYYPQPVYPQPGTQPYPVQPWYPQQQQPNFPPHMQAPSHVTYAPDPSQQLAYDQGINFAPEGQVYSRGPRRNGDPIENPQGGLPLDQMVTAEVPPLASTWGGGPRHVRRDSV